MRRVRTLLSAGSLHFQQAEPIAGKERRELHYASTGGCLDERHHAEVIYVLGSDRAAVLGSGAICTKESESQVVYGRNCPTSGSAPDSYAINLGTTPGPLRGPSGAPPWGNSGGKAGASWKEVPGALDEGGGGIVTSHSASEGYWTREETLPEELPEQDGGGEQSGVMTLLLPAERQSQKNGLWAFSSATVVRGPWPGQSSVSGGRVRICSRTFWRASSHDWLPRPIEPANIASPTMATCGASSGQVPMM